MEDTPVTVEDGKEFESKGCRNWKTGNALLKANVTLT